MQVPFLDLKEPYLELKHEIDTAISRVVGSGWYILGDEVERFEHNFAHFTESKYAVGVANGLDALKIALQAIEIKPTDEILVPSNTFIATWLAVSECGATPVPIEPCERNYNIDPSRIESAITSKTRAIILVHLYGLPANLDEIIKICRKHKLWIVEDAAQAHGAKYKGKRIGSHGDITAWSFYPGKNLGAMGDGGCLTTNSEELFNQSKRIRNYGSTEKYVHSVKGTNSRLDPIQAAILDVKLKYLDVWNARRRNIANQYISSIKNHHITLPTNEDGKEHAWHLFVIRTNYRAALQKYLQSRGISTLIHYPLPPHRQKAYDLKVELPIAEMLSDKVLSLPIGPHMSSSQVRHVIDSVNCFEWRPI